jgi:hypothetical protein
VRSHAVYDDANGSSLVVGGPDNPTTLMSTEYDHSSGIHASPGSMLSEGMSMGMP